MARFTSQTYGSRTIYLDVIESSVDSVNNTSVVSWTCSTSGDSYWYVTEVNVTINGTSVLATGRCWPEGDYFPVAAGHSVSGSITVTHDSNGSKTIPIGFSVSIYSWSPEEHGGSFGLTTIDRSSPTVSISCGSPGTTSIPLTVSANGTTCDAFDYSIDGGNSWRTFSTSSGTSASTTISGLALNTTYSIVGRARKALNHIYGQSSATSIKTLGYSTISSAANATLGGHPSISWTPLDATFKFKIQLTLGSFNYVTDDYIQPGSLQSYTWGGSYTLSIADIAPKIPNSTTGTMNVVLYTYQANGSEIGSSSSSFTVSIPATDGSGTPIAPTFEYALSEGTASGFGRYATTLSTLRAAFTDISGSYGSTPTAASLEINGVIFNGTISNGSITLTSSTLLTAGLNRTVTLVVYDSRGRYTTKTTTINIYEYHTPNIVDVDLNYNSNTGVTTIETSYDIASVDNQNTKKLGITAIKSSAPGTIIQIRPESDFPQGYDYTGNIEIDTSALTEVQTEMYEITVTIKDSKNTTTFLSKTGIICMSRYAGGKGVRFFGEAYQNGFMIDDVGYSIPNNVYDSLCPGHTNDRQLSTLLQNLWSKLYPVGCVYMSTDSTSPATLFGGTWSRIDDRMLIGAGTSYSAGSMGGSYSHTHTTGDFTLGASHVPAHTHTRGTMEIWGSVNNTHVSRFNFGRDGYTATGGALSLSGSRDGYTGGYGPEGSAFSTLDFQASKNWTGETSSYGSGGAHNHGSTGSTANIPPYYAVYMWIRTA